MQPLEDLPRVKRAKIQFTIEKPDEEAEEVKSGMSRLDVSAAEQYFICFRMRRTPSCSTETTRRSR